MEMQSVILFCCFAVSALAVPILEEPLNNITHFFYEVSPGVYLKEDLTIEPEYNAEVSDVIIYFYSRNIDGVSVNLSDLSTLSNTDFSNTKPTVFCLHGWKADYTADVNVKTRMAYLQLKDVNFFVVDWSNVANQLYVVAQTNVQSIGEILGQLINNLVSGAGLILGNTALVGHSLGAHIVGVAGKYIGGTADQVVGLDPAGPLFLMSYTNNRIDPKSGRFVEVIHTNTALLGMNGKLGDADYWPNGGTTQPGCGLDACSHLRSIDYYYESLISGHFTARSCSDLVTYTIGICANNPTSYMGEILLDKA